MAVPAELAVACIGECTLGVVVDIVGTAEIDPVRGIWKGIVDIELTALHRDISYASERLCIPSYIP